MIIDSILDNDLYKFTMQHAVIKLFPRAKAQFSFVNRGKTAFPDGFAAAVQTEIDAMANLKLSKKEKLFLEEACYYLPPTYLDFLQGYRFSPSEVLVTQHGGELSIEIEGYWYRAILWEVPLMAIISELYFKLTKQEPNKLEWRVNQTVEKAKQYKALGISFADFGTRRRFSKENHALVIETLKAHSGMSFIGTSNVHFAHLYDIKPIGTHAHEWFMFHAAKYGYKLANQLALDNWVDVYRGDLGIALSDTFTSDVFFQSFDTKLAKLFDGVRQDSGDPLVFADKTIAHYRKLHIDPKAKTIIFSDNLKPETVAEITEYCKDKIRISFGIGTNLTNDVGVAPLNMVIKLTAARPEDYDHWIGTVKLSDSKGKYTGSEAAVELCQRTLCLDSDADTC